MCLGRKDQRHHLTFVPRIRESGILAGNFSINAMIDVSDGLISDMRHIVEESGVGARIYLERIPRAPGCRGFKKALTGGEDFELVFTLSPKEARRLEKVKAKLFRTPLTRIGEMTGKEVCLIDGRGRRADLSNYRGYDHFREN